MYDYLYDLVNNGSKLVTWRETVEFSNGSLTAFDQGSLRYFQRPSNAPPPYHRFADYSQICLAGRHSYLSPPAFRTVGVNRTGFLALDFPTRSKDYQFFRPPKHSKCIAISETMYTVSVHKHTGARIRGKYYVRTPYESRIILDPDVCASHHFVSMFGGRRSSRMAVPKSDHRDEFAVYHAREWEEFLDGGHE